MTFGVLQETRYKSSKLKTALKYIGFASLRVCGCSDDNRIMPGVTTFVTECRRSSEKA